MPTTEESTQAIGWAKAAIDNGFSRVGRTLSSGDRVAGWLYGASGRAVALSDAVILLCREHHAAEAASLARAVIGLAADMRWLATDGTAERRIEVLEREARGRDWGALWSSERLCERFSASGLGEPEVERWAEEVRRLCAGHLAGGSSGLPWAHAFEVSPARLSAEEVLAATAGAMEEVVRALGARWRGYFGS